MGRIIAKSKCAPAGCRMGRECPTNEESGPGWGHLWVENFQQMKIWPRMGSRLGREFPTNEEFAPGRGAVWVENVQQMKIWPRRG